MMYDCEQVTYAALLYMELHNETFYLVIYGAVFVHGCCTVGFRSLGKQKSAEVMKYPQILLTIIAESGKINWPSIMLICNRKLFYQSLKCADGTSSSRGQIGINHGPFIRAYLG